MSSEGSKKIVVGIIGLGAVGAVIALARSAKARARGFARKGVGAGVQLSKNFSTTEFLTSKVAPDLINWQIPPRHFSNLKSLVTQVLQPARDKFGPIKINNGYRPVEYRNPEGKSIFRLLKEAGYKPSKTSDHYHGQAADIFPLDISQAIPLFKWLRDNERVRQVIMYFKTTPKGPRLSLIHVAVATEERPAFKGRKRWWYNLDNKRVETIPMP